MKKSCLQHLCAEEHTFFFPPNLSMCVIYSAFSNVLLVNIYPLNAGKTNTDHLWCCGDNHTVKTVAKWPLKSALISRDFTITNSF